MFLQALCWKYARLIKTDTSDLKVRNRGMPEAGARIGGFGELRFEDLAHR
jgi:hypothetical protein